ncbi:MAG: ABC transporter ATP-binding protein [Lachnospiraceae bacterium]|nr:ABC transporter ATP-binding protein [Lachnospiraceae bacterium]
MRYINKVLSKNKGLIFSYIAIGIAHSFLVNFKADYFQKVIDGLTNHTIILAGILLYGAVLIGDYLLEYADEYPSKKLEHGIYLDFKLMALKKISRIDYEAYQSLGTGKLVQRIENGSEAGKNLLYDFWFCVIRQLIPTILFSVHFIWKISRPITYAILGGYIIIFLITNALLKVLYQIKERILTNEEEMNHYLVRGFMEMLVFRMENQFPNEIRKAATAKKEIVRSKVKMNMVHEAFFTIFAVLVGFLNIGILIYAWNTKAFSVGSVVALLSLLDNAYTPIAIFNVLYVQYKLDKASFRKYESFLGLRDDEQLESGEAICGLTGDIEIQNLSFSYGDRKILDGLNLTIRKGEKVAFVGESGSGKSTLVKILAGLVKYDAGSIRIDGEELKDIRLNSLYDHISYISQDCPIFDGTLKENLVFDQDVDESRLKEAMASVQLLPLLDTMKDGMQTEIGERGTILSGGERQRLALARLWFEKKDLTILDEATSAMDNLTEEHVMKAVTELLDDRTVIAIAHRLNSVASFDRIIVFGEGKIIADAPFQTLLTTSPYFAALYHASVGGRLFDLGESRAVYR